MALYSIGIRNLEVHSPVGIHAEERLLKVKLLVTATLTFAETDQLPISLQGTFDYAKLAELIAGVCREQHNLLEQVAHGIVHKLRPILDKPCQLHLRIEKKHPVPGVNMESAFIDVVEQLTPGKTRR